MVEDLAIQETAGKVAIAETEPLKLRESPQRPTRNLVTVKNVVILGATGSIGDSTLDVLRHLGENFNILGLSGGRQLEKLSKCVSEWEPSHVCVGEADDVSVVAKNFRGEIFSGSDGLCVLASHSDADIVINGLVGSVGLRPTLAALEAGKIVAIANKEPLVMAGSLIKEAARRFGGEILPLDSEPNAIWQCLHGEEESSLRRIILTASGGPFRGRKMSELGAITPEEALQHPTWKMGDKISVDSATLMNKGFEVIEAACLFNISVECVEVVVHRQSVVHSLVELVDGSILAHMGETDMRLPIQYALTYPHRSASPLDFLDLTKVGQLSFEEPDRENFPCLDLCYMAGRIGNGAQTVLNAANEVSVSSFLERKISFLDIFELNSDMLSLHGHEKAGDIEEILCLDEMVRATSVEWVAGRG
ncbi:MAG: 1-deoxy-D-xylulose-5-phosphate reductoisomerase [Candidatus Latescibacterota bacterium]|nr:1-deoxy-D-xylulose-5-phosphate reductoisomerase [Candidatus Latescibacterota bacterium]